MSWEEIIPEFNNVKKYSLGLGWWDVEKSFAECMNIELTKILKKNGYDYTYVGEVVDVNCGEEFDHIFCPYKPLNIYEKITDNRKGWRDKMWQRAVRASRDCLASEIFKNRCSSYREEDLIHAKVYKN